MANLKDVAATLALLGSGALTIAGCEKDKPATEVPGDAGGAEDMAEGSCGGDKAEGSCGGDKAEGEGSCGGDKHEGDKAEGDKGEGSCGAAR